MMSHLNHCCHQYPTENTTIFILQARERDATAYEKRMGQEMSAHLRELIAPHFLRRTKDILEQTKKTITGDGISHDNVDGGSDKENEETNG